MGSINHGRFRTFLSIRWALLALVLSPGFALSGSTTSQDCIKNKKKGESCPLYLIDKIAPPPPQDGCDKTSWETGFRQALGGQHYLLRFSKSPPDHVRNYRGCKDLSRRNEESVTNCCFSGFRSGLRELSAHFEEIKKRATTQNNSTIDPEAVEDISDFPETLCASSHWQGEIDAERQCRYYQAQDGHLEGSLLSSPTKPECPKFDPMSVTYLGCYQLGFLKALTQCHCQKGRDAKSLFPELSSPEITNAVSPGKSGSPITEGNTRNSKNPEQAN